MHTFSNDNCSAHFSSDLSGMVTLRNANGQEFEIDGSFLKELMEELARRKGLEESEAVGAARASRLTARERVNDLIDELRRELDESEEKLRTAAELVDAIGTSQPTPGNIAALKPALKLACDVEYNITGECDVFGSIAEELGVDECGDEDDGDD